MPHSRSVVPVALDNRMQHFGRLYVNNIRAAHRPPLGTSEAIYSNHYTSAFVEEDVFVAKLHWLRHRANGLFRRRPDPDDFRGRPRYRDWEY
ncbi:hypothetical protein N8I77_001472 [Diaporthe amygdali]|uniref:Uncharacterized protein n=1 Tax=Phomopsis amygdali TaxID=1214568 RepID=A0AAD9SR03_PHOAM|nr:uncharacterized protein J7T55_012994 [Diaporthe amygdali]KAJ0118740.1 hypothetical protein J7T55_012994 [Diaporthe amygdali]KAK2614666.1 hypothetical protein N8I77_001472 [Diaporthe amygdali]